MPYKYKHAKFSTVNFSVNSYFFLDIGSIDPNRCTDVYTDNIYYLSKKISTRPAPEPPKFAQNGLAGVFGPNSPVMWGQVFLA